MHFGIVATNIGSYAEPKTVIQIAELAERSGWEALFIWDHLAYVWSGPAGDPWVILAAVAASTERLKLGTCISPIPRYRPHVLAGTLTTLDALSGGRAILGAGIGGKPHEFTAFGEPGDPVVRAAMLDEGLDVIDALWRGEPVSHHGASYTVEDVTFQPRPVQQPRIPIWIGGNSPRALRRAAHWDGWIADSAEPEHMNMSPEEFSQKLGKIRELRSSNADFDAVVMGYSAADDPELARAFEVAGATWWLESLHDLRGGVDEMSARVEAGPPR